MDERARLEARVWSRIMGQSLEIPRENEDFSALLGSEYADLSFYRCLAKYFPCSAGEIRKLICLAENSIKYLKAVYYVETGRCYMGKCPGNMEICCLAESLRQQLQKLNTTRQLWEKWDVLRENKERQSCILMQLLTKVLG